MVNSSLQYKSLSQRIFCKKSGERNKIKKDKWQIKGCNINHFHGGFTAIARSASNHTRAQSHVWKLSAILGVMMMMIIIIMIFIMMISMMIIMISMIIDDDDYNNIPTFLQIVCCLPQGLFSQ